MADMSGELLLTYESLLKDLYTLSKSADFAKCRPHTTRSFYKRATFTGGKPWVVPVAGVQGCPEAVLPDCPEVAGFPF